MTDEQSAGHDAQEGHASEVFERIREHLEAHNVAYRHIHHEPVRTSEQAARVRGESVRIGGKALVLRADDAFHLLVLSAALKLDNARVKDVLGTKKPRFATPEELMDLTGLVPGSVPPFGRPILPLPLLVDESILANERIAFNAGSRSDSIIMSVEDYRRVAMVERIVDIAQR